MRLDDYIRVVHLNWESVIVIGVDCKKYVT